MNQLDYESKAQNSRPRSSKLPLGLASFVFGLAAAVGIPVLDMITRWPGYVQSRLLIIGSGLAVCAIVIGFIGTIMPGQRVRASIGIALGMLALFLLPAFQRA